MGGHRVFITGMGIVSPVGNHVGKAFEEVFAGRSSFQHQVPRPDTRDPAAIVAPADFDSSGEIPRLRARFMARVSEMAVLAARDAMASAGLETQAPRQSLGVYLGCALGGAEALENHYVRYAQDQRIRAATTPLIMCSGPAAHISMHLGILGPTLTYSVACVSSTMALGEAFRSIRHGYLSSALAGGAEAQLNVGSVSAWSAMGALATEHPDGVGASSRPFDAERSGLVLGEGAALLVLESEESMHVRGAEPMAEVVGFGMASDGHDLMEPHKDGQLRAMRSALEDGAVRPEQVGYINAHATGTPTGDRVEVEAIHQVFGAAATSVPVSSTKGVHGHLVGAAGALDAVWTVMALHTGRIPPTANLTHPDPTCDLDCVPQVGRPVSDLEFALSNSFAFGGSNAALVLRKP